MGAAACHSAEISRSLQTIIMVSFKLSISLAVCILLGTSALASAQCDGLLEFQAEGYCFSLNGTPILGGGAYPDDWLSRDDAEQACQEQGGSLARFSAVSWQAFEDMYPSNLEERPFHDSRLWTAGVRLGDGLFAWNNTDGTQTNLTDVGLGSMPWVLDGRHDGDCVIAAPNIPRPLYGVPCEEKRAHICQQDVDECAGAHDCTFENAVCENTAGSYTCGCAEGFHFYNDACYQYAP